MNYNYKYQTTLKQSFGAPPPKKRKGSQPTNRISEGYANAIKASNTNGYIANANMMSYKTGEDFLRHNQPRLNTVLNRLKNDPSTLNMNYYGKKTDPIEVRNYQYAKGPDAYNARNRGELRFATYHAKDRDPIMLAAPPSPAFAGPRSSSFSLSGHSPLFGVSAERKQRGRERMAAKKAADSLMKLRSGGKKPAKLHTFRPNTRSQGNVLLAFSPSGGNKRRKKGSSRNLFNQTQSNNAPVPVGSPLLNQAQGPDARTGITDDDIMNMTADELLAAMDPNDPEGSFHYY